MKRAPSAPSITRWSNDKEIGRIKRGAKSLPFHTGSIEDLDTPKIATSGAGKQIELTYLRDGKSNTAKVTLQSDEQTQTTANSLLPALDGAELNNYDEKGVKGVSIGKIKPNSLAEQRGLKNGDVIIGINRQKVENLGQLRKALDSKPSAIALNIIRGDSNFYLLVQ